MLLRLGVADQGEMWTIGQQSSLFDLKCGSSLAVESKDRGYYLNRKAASLDKYIVRKGSTS